MIAPAAKSELTTVPPPAQLAWRASGPSIPATDPAHLPALVAQVRQAQRAWQQLGPSKRRPLLRKLGAVLAEQTDAIAAAIVQDTGKPSCEAILHEILGVVHLTHYFAQRAPSILAATKLRSSLLLHRISTIHYVPRGVVAVISPWNFPFALAMGDIVMALAAGNGVIVKPSEITPHVLQGLPDWLAQAGIDPKLVALVHGDGSIGRALLEQQLDMVHFTGSVATGRSIGAFCGSKLIPCVLELGGKDAAIVCQDADLPQTARNLLFGALMNSGQTCASIERVFVAEQVLPALLSHLLREVQALRQDHGPDGAIDLGPMITPQQYAVVERQVQAAVAAGAKVHCGGVGKAPFYPPTILTQVQPEMAICAEETFGPVLPLIPVQNMEQAISLVNQSPYGLSAAIYSRNVAQASSIAEKLQVGTVTINDVLLTHAAPEAPWGGLKESGLGFTHSDEGLRHLCEQRHINRPNPWLPLQALWLFPYGAQWSASARDLIIGWYGDQPWWRRLIRLLQAFRRGMR